VTRPSPLFSIRRPIEGRRLGCVVLLTQGVALGYYISRLRREETLHKKPLKKLTSSAGGLPPG
ncbi:MAG: hypothetical protein ACR2H6_04015, partial [Pyrinomonadaceae bacterium]